MRHLIAVLVVSAFVLPAIRGTAELSNSAATIAEVLAVSGTDSISTERKVLFCWSKPDHPFGTHGYEAFAKTMSTDFASVDKVSGGVVNGFPSPEQWQDADLVVFFLTQKSLNAGQYALMDAHLKRGRSIIVLHQGLVQRAAWDQWADRVGYAFSWNKDGRSKWGQFDNPVTLDVSHEILKGFPREITFKDEFYWNLEKGRRGQITVLGECRAPANKEKADVKWPAIWTVEHEAAGTAPAGRVFCVVMGHFNYLHQDPVYRALVLRGAAWCLREPFGPFARLVTKPATGN